MTDKQELYAYRTMRKNQYILYSKLMSGNLLFIDLDLLASFLKGEKARIDWSAKKLISTELFLSREKLNDIYRKYFFSFNEYNNFELKASMVAKKHGLGKEWNKTFFFLFTSDILFPPEYNLYINDINSDGVVKLHLNADTSQDDIKNAWESILESQYNLTPSNYRSVNLTEKSFQRLELALKDKLSPKSTYNDVNTLEEYIITDKERVQSIWPLMENEPLDSTEIKNKENLLRKIRHRIKRFQNPS